MRHALGGIESILGRREVTDERIVTIALLAGVAVMAFGKFELFGISPGAVVAAVFCMLAAYSKGIAAVSCAAAAAGGGGIGNSACMSLQTAAVHICRHGIRDGSHPVFQKNHPEQQEMQRRQ